MGMSLSQFSKKSEKLPKEVPAQSIQCESGETTITLGNSFCDVLASANVLKEIEKVLTYENNEVIQELRQVRTGISVAIHYKNYKKAEILKARVKELEAQQKVCWFRNSSFPTGHISIVRELLTKMGISPRLVDKRVKNTQRMILEWIKEPHTLRHYQESAVQKATEEGRGVIVHAVGTGKTRTIQEICYRLKVPTLIISPAKDLSIQTYEDFKSMFGSAKVGYIEGSKKFKGAKAINVVTIHTLTSAYKNGLLDEILKGLGCVIIDEVHHFGADSYTDLLPHFKHIYYRFGCSGTFLRNDSKTLDMMGFLSNVLHRYTAAEATKEGYLTPLKVRVHKVDGIFKPIYQKEYDKNYCNNPELLFKVRDILKEETKKTQQVLILVGRKDKTGKYIHEYLKTLGYSADYVDGDCKRDDIKESILKFNQKKVSILIGSSVLGEGIDIRSTDHLILATGGKSEIQISQALGRAVRLFEGKTEAVVHDFDFEGTKFLVKHLKIRMDIYRRNFEGEVI